MAKGYVLTTFRVPCSPRFLTRLHFVHPFHRWIHQASLRFSLFLWVSFLQTCFSWVGSKRSLWFPQPSVASLLGQSSQLPCAELLSISQALFIFASHSEVSWIQLYFCLSLPLLELYSCLTGETVVYNYLPSMISPLQSCQCSAKSS